MTNDRDTFVQGATAFRNARDLAKHHRDSSILAANGRASQQAIPAPQGDLTATAQLDPDEVRSADEFVDYPDSSPPRNPDNPRVTDFDDYSQGSTLPELGDTTTSFAFSFTSDFTADRPKRPRPSPDSKFNTQAPRPRIAILGGRPSQSSPRLGLSPIDEAEQVWVETYWHEGHICFHVEKEKIKTDRKDWTLQTQQNGMFCFRWQDARKQTIWTKELAEDDTGHGYAAPSTYRWFTTEPELGSGGGAWCDSGLAVLGLSPGQRADGLQAARRQ